MGNYFYRQFIRGLKNIGFLFGRLGLVRKLILTYAVVLLIPIAVFATSFLGNTRMNMEQDALDNSVQMVKYTMMNIDRNIEILERAAQSVVGNMDFIRFISDKKEHSVVGILEFSNGLLREVQNIQNLNPGINRLRIFLDNPYFMQMTPTIYNEAYINKEPIWEDIIAREGKIYWVMNQKKDYLASPNGRVEISVSLYREIRYPAKKHLGILEVSMSQQRFFGDLSSHTEDEQSFFCFYSGNTGSIDFNTEINVIEENSTVLEKIEDELDNRITGQSGHFVTSIGKVEMLVAYDYIEKIDNYVCYFKPTSGYLRQVENTGLMVIVTSLAIFALLVVVTYFIISVILKKIKIILSTMRKVEEGVIDIELPVAGKDEIGEIAFHMRKMVGRINELVNTLDEMQSELQKGENTQERIQEVNELIYQFRINELNYILLNDNLSEMEIRNTLDTIKIEMLQRESRLAVVLAYDESGAEMNTENVLSNLKAFAHKYANENGLPVFCFIDTEKHLVMIINEQLDLMGLAESIEKRMGIKTVTAVSDSIRNATRICETYKNMYEALEYRVMPGYGRVLKYDEIRELSDEFTVPLDEIRKIQHMMTANKTERIEEILDNIFCEHKVREFKIDYAKRVAEVINQYIIQHFIEYIPHKAGKLKQDYNGLASIASYRSLDNYLEELKCFIKEICSFFEAVRNEEKGMDEIDTAIRYINENYNKELSMGMVANHVSLNYHYFSSRFNERAGMSFVDYLKRVRVEKAKVFLKDSDLKIQEIACRVGYDNPKYFARIFREMTGFSPQEFRK